MSKRGQKKKKKRERASSGICLLPLQDLRCALQKSRSELQEKEAALKESEAERVAAAQEKERSITQLRHALQDKEQQLEVEPTSTHHNGDY